VILIALGANLSSRYGSPKETIEATTLALENAGVQDVTELQKSAPNVTMQVSRGTNSTLTSYVRGIGQADPLWGFEPGVGLYVDDIYLARPQGGVLDVFDVERIEVIKGTVDRASANAQYEVDGLAGATLTTRGISNLVQYWLGEDGFAPFLENLKSGEA